MHAIVKMRGIHIVGTAKDHGIALADHLAKPIAQASDILVHVHAAAVTADEQGWPETYTIESRIPGHEMSGVVEQLGPKYAGHLKIGDEVFALLTAGKGQCQAEWVVCTPAEVAVKPRTLSHGVVSALPMASLTALEMMNDQAPVRPGMHVLVTGASGAVGQMLVQLLAQISNISITALASSRHDETLHRLGASNVLDYRTSWQTELKDVDVVFDLVGGEVLTKCWEVVTDRGTIVTIGDPAPAWAVSDQPPTEAARKPGVRYKYFIVKADGERLAKLANMLDEGVLQPLPIKAYSLDDGGAAWRDAEGRSRGYKVVLQMVEDSGHAKR